ncbi:MAG TPA: hypothetical protein VGS57_00370 [Thermoanaerobaculia bacterium]|jgi:hypothetical protein|nr:hypothetical protein [Thermoanaerobaculia bacterium]
MEKLTWPGVRGVFALAVLSLVLLTPACNGHDSPTERSQSDVVTIDGIVPAITTVLRRGTQVTISVTAGYTLSSASEGRLALVLQDQDNHVIGPLPQPEARVVRGQGSVTLSSTLTVPASATMVRVFVPLTPQGATSTSTLATASYTVTP